MMRILDLFCGAGGAAAMGIDWMTGDELSQAIPPAYSRSLARFIRGVGRSAA